MSDDLKQKADDATAQGEVVLQLSGLKTFFHTDDGVVKAVNDVTFDIRAGQTLGLVGESGSGKSVTSLTVMQLLPESNSRIAGGEVVFLGQDLLKLSRSQVRGLRGNDMAMIFQEPMTSLNPVFTVGDQVAEALRLHKGLCKTDARKRTIELFDQVGIPTPGILRRQLPARDVRRAEAARHDRHGPGLRSPAAHRRRAHHRARRDHPGPDPRCLLRTLRDEYGMAILFITHDLGVIAEIADRVAVMFRGRLVE